jgi:cyclohexyl-isocyanide hydratase
VKLIDIGFLIFPDMQQLDLTAPYEVFATWGGARFHLVGRNPDIVISSTGLTFKPSVTFDQCRRLDILCVPGGAGINPLLADEETLHFVRQSALSAQIFASICTGSLVLGAAGLLRGKRATTHWTCMDLLSAFGATPTPERVVRDGALMTGGGVTAGMDFALALIGEIAGREQAEAVQLQLEYAPQPPFDAGSPSTASRSVMKTVRARGAAMRAERERLVAQAAAKLG